MTPTFRIQRPGGIALTLSGRGATWLSCEVPVAGRRRDVILRRAADSDNSYVGATIGRYANRIKDARIRRDDGNEWSLVPNPGSPHQLHGGPGGFHVQDWEVATEGDFTLRCSLRSPDGDQGFPGRLEVETTYCLSDAMTIEMETVARVDTATPIAITNHAYFNLDGAGHDVRDHRLLIRAPMYMPVDAALIPFGPPQPVENTGFDFRQSKRILDEWLADAQQAVAGGYDHAFLLDPACAHAAQPACELSSSRGDLRLAIHTTLPALQFYGGQGLARVNSPEGRPFAPCAALALEPGFLPDSPNHPEWPQPSCWLEPSAEYRHLIRYHFDAS